MRASVAETAGAFDYRCTDPRRLLATVGWAERGLYVADVADIGPREQPGVDHRVEAADRVGRLRHHAGRTRRDVRSARFVYRAFDADRPDDADPFAGALASNRRAAGAAAAGDEVAATLERR